MTNTYCPQCKKLLIKRTNYHVTRYDKNGRCACGKNFLAI